MSISVWTRIIGLGALIGAVLGAIAYFGSMAFAHASPIFLLLVSPYLYFFAMGSIGPDISISFFIVGQFLYGVALVFGAVAIHRIASRRKTS
jgi:hypothetical protein